MVEKKIPGFNGAVWIDDTAPAPRTRRSLFPTREQVASLAGLPLPQPRTAKQSPQPNVATAAQATQEAGSDADEAELDSFEVVEAPSPLESAPLNPGNEPAHAPATAPRPQHSSFRTPTVPRPEGYRTPPHGPSFSPITPPAQLATENSDAGQNISPLELPAPLAAIRPPESTSALRSSSSGTPTVLHSEGSKTPPHGLSSSPIAPPVKASAESNDAGEIISSLELPAPAAAVNRPDLTSALHSSPSSAPTVPRPDGSKAPPQGLLSSPIAPLVQPSAESNGAGQSISSLELPAPVAAAHSPFGTPAVPRSEGSKTQPHGLPSSPTTRLALVSAENNNIGRNSSPVEQDVSAVRDEPTAPQATEDHQAIESDNEELSEYEEWDATPAPPPQQLTPISERAAEAQGASDFPILNLPTRVIHRILDLLLVYDEPIALVRKSPSRRIVEANKSHILTVGKGKITREPQNKKMKSNVARTINTASPTNLFLVCRGLRDLGIKTYYNKNTFAFSDREGLAGWAASIGSRRNEVRSVELRSEWEVVFKNNDIHIANSKKLNMRGKGVLYTTAIRTLGNIETVDVDIALRMPWQRTGKLPDYDQVSPKARKICFEHGKKMVKLMAKDFRNLELNTPLIAKGLHIWFDEAWVEPWYESAEFKRRDAEDKRKLAEERAAKASKEKDS